MRTARGGECCGPAPIPIPLLNDPLLEMEAIHNTTAQKIFNLAGTYTWTNYSFSTNIMRVILHMTVLPNPTELKFNSIILSFIFFSATDSPRQYY